MDIDVVCEGLVFPEGPVAMADGSVIVVEIEGQRLTRVLPDGTKQTVAEVPGGPNGAAIGPDGAIYVCNNGGRFEFLKVGDLTFAGPAPDSHKGGSIQRVDIVTGKVTTLYTECEGRPLWAPNDLVFDRQGGLWFTDNGRNNGRTLELGGLYYCRTDGSEIRPLRRGMISPNGVGLSPDESEVYVADTALCPLWAFALKAPGVLGEQPFRQHGRIVANLQGYQLVDSLAVEAGGKVCVATLMNGGITIFDPVSGETEHTAFPDAMTTNIAFGGADMRDAWITGSSTGRLFKCRWPRPGLKLNFSA
ncbi:MAG: SMP-30/gluconolactonase/LRE family protein [Alphaproteobacteria bacterium]